MRTLSLPFVVTLAILAACGTPSSKEPRTITTPLIGSAFQGLAFTAKLIETARQSSVVKFFDFAAGTITTTLEDQSADPLLATAGSHTFLFNRAGAKNFREIDPITAHGATPGAFATPGAQDSDPQSVVALDDEHLLLAQRLGGALVVVSRTDGRLVSRLTAADFSGLDILRPAALLKMGDRVFVLHQGLNRNLKCDGTQRILSVRWNGNELKPTGSRGTAIKPSLAQGFHSVSGDSAVVVGFTRPSDSACAAGGQRIALNAGTTSDLLLPGLEDYQFRNQVIDGPANVLYASVSAASLAQNVVVRIDLATPARLSLRHSYGTSSDRLYGLFYDSSTETLLIGDEDASQGLLRLVHERDGTAETVMTGELPYNGIFVR